MSDLFSTGLSGLSIARTALVTTAHNTANVYTDGYSRQRVVVQTNPATAVGGGYVGSGARVASIQRSYDGFLNSQLAQADASATQLETYSSQISRVDNLLADRTSGLSVLMQNFFAGAQSVADTPADPAARQQLLSSAQTLAGKFRSVDSYLTDLNTSINEQLQGTVGQVNGIAVQIATLNRQIGQLQAAANGEPPNDLLDTRDKLVADLSKIAGVTVVAQDNGQYNVFVGSGHTLVLGDRASQMTVVKSSADPTRYAVALQGAGGNITELRDADVTGGALGGLLAFRDESLVTTQNAVGRLAAALASAFNSQHADGVDLLGNAGQPFFSFTGPQVFKNQQNAGNLEVTASISDATRLTASEYSVQVQGTGFVVTRLPEGQQVPVTIAPTGADATSFTSISFDGVTVQPSAAGLTPQSGDSFMVQPTRAAAANIAVLVTDPSKIAAGAAGSTGPSDGRNALALAALQRQPLLDGGTTTLSAAYAQLVSGVGNRAMEANVAASSQGSLASQVKASQQSVSGVNQDEETANLLKFQQMYQANAKVIQAASTIFDTILGLR